jgi:hypothetical protein
MTWGWSLRCKFAFPHFCVESEICCLMQAMTWLWLLAEELAERIAGDIFTPAFKTVLFCLALQAMTWLWLLAEELAERIAEDEWQHRRRPKVLGEQTHCDL